MHFRDRSDSRQPDWRDGKGDHWGGEEQIGVLTTRALDEGRRFGQSGARTRIGRSVVKPPAQAFDVNQFEAARPPKVVCPGRNHVGRRRSRGQAGLLCKEAIELFHLSAALTACVHFEDAALIRS